MADEPPSPATSTPHRYNLRNRESLATPSNSFSTRTQRRPRTSTSSARADTQLPANIAQWRKEDLIGECKEKGLQTDGTKAVLIARIRAHRGVAAPSPGRRPASRASDGSNIQTPLRRSRRQTTVPTETTASETKEFETPVARSTRTKRPSERPTTGRKRGVPPTRTPATRTLPRRAAAAAYRSDPPATGEELLTPPQATARKLQLETNAPAQAQSGSTRARSKGTAVESNTDGYSFSRTIEDGGSETGSATKAMMRRRVPQSNRPVSATMVNFNSNQPLGAGEETPPQETTRNLHLESNAPAQAQSTSSRARSKANSNEDNIGDESVALSVEDGGSATRARTRSRVTKSSKPVLATINNSNSNPKSMGDVNFNAASGEEEQGIEGMKRKGLHSGNATDALSKLPANSSVGAMGIVEGGQPGESCANDNDSVAAEASKTDENVFPASGLEIHKGEESAQPVAAVPDMPSSANIVDIEPDFKSVPDQNAMEALAVDPTQTSMEDDLQSEKPQASDKAMEIIVEDAHDAQKSDRLGTKDSDSQIEKEPKGEKEQKYAPMSPAMDDVPQIDKPSGDVKAAEANAGGDAVIPTVEDGDGLPELPAISSADAMDIFGSEEPDDASGESLVKDKNSVAVKPVTNVLLVSDLGSHKGEQIGQSDVAMTDVRPSADIVATETDAKSVWEEPAGDPAPVSKEDDLPAKKLDADDEKVMSSVVEDVNDAQQSDCTGMKRSELQMELEHEEEMEQEHATRSPAATDDIVPASNDPGDNKRTDDDILAANSTSYVHSDEKEETLVRAPERAGPVDVSMPGNNHVDVHSSVNIVVAEGDAMSARDELAIEGPSAGPAEVSKDDDLPAKKLDADVEKVMSSVVEDTNDAQLSDRRGTKDSETRTECKEENEQERTSISPSAMDVVFPESSSPTGNEIGEDHGIAADSTSSDHADEKEEHRGKAPILVRRIPVKENEQTTSLDAGIECAGESVPFSRHVKQSVHDADSRNDAAVVCENAIEHDSRAAKDSDVGEDSQSYREDSSDKKCNTSPNGQDSEGEREEIEEAAFSRGSLPGDAGSRADRQHRSAPDDRGHDSDMSFSFEEHDSAPDEDAQFSSAPSGSGHENTEDMPELPNRAENAVIEAEDGSDQEVNDYIERMNESEYSSNSEVEEIDESSLRVQENEVIDIDAESELDSREEEGSGRSSGRSLSVYVEEDALSAASAEDNDVIRIESIEIDGSMPTAHRLTEPSEHRSEEAPESIVRSGTPEPPAAARPVDTGDDSVCEDEILPNGDMVEKENGAPVADQELSEGRNIIGVKRGREPEEEYVERLGECDGGFQSTPYAEHSAQRKRHRIEDVVAQLQHYMPTPDATIQEIVVSGSIHGRGQTENMLLPTVHADEKKRSSLLERLTKLEGETVRSSLFTPESMETCVSPKRFSGAFHMGTSFGSSRNKRGGSLSSAIRKHSLNPQPVRPRRIQARGVWDASKLADYSSQRAAELSAEVRAWRQVGKTNKSVWSRPPLPNRDSGLLRRY